jgi:hypothetical protein
LGLCYLYMGHNCQKYHYIRDIRNHISDILLMVLRIMNVDIYILER